MYNDQTYQYSLVLASFPQRDHVANNHLCHSHQATPSDTSERTKDYELRY